MQQTYRSQARAARTLAEVFDDAIATLRQDAGEYAFIALLGAAPACFGVLVLHFIGHPVALALAPVVVIACAALTLAAATEAFRRVSENLAPDAAEAFALVALRSYAFVRPWLMLALVLGGATGAAAFFGEYLPAIAHAGIQLAALALCWMYAMPRTFVTVALLTQRCSYRQAEQGSAVLANSESGRVVSAWAIALGPALMLGLVAALAGFGSVSSALAALALVGLMPVAAVITSLLFFDALSRPE